MASKFITTFKDIDIADIFENFPDISKLFHIKINFECFVANISRTLWCGYIFELFCKIFCTTPRFKNNCFKY